MTYHGTATVQYFERDAFVGERRVYCCGASSGGESFSALWPHTAYVCPLCGQLWGRAVYQYEFDYSPRVRMVWAVEVRRCVSCGDGAFLVSQDLDSCSHSLLQREATILLLREP